MCARSKKAFLWIAVLSVLVVGCKHVDTDAGVQSVSEVTLYSYGIQLEHSYLDSGQIESEICFDNRCDGFKAGAMIFLDGIPQSLCNEQGRESRCSVCEIPEQESISYSLSWEPVGLCDISSHVIRGASILGAEVMASCDAAYNIDPYHRLLQTTGKIMKDEPERIQEISVEKLLPEEVTDSNESSVEQCFGTVEIERNVWERGELSGAYSLSVSAQNDVEYILSFWGDNENIQLGSERYYRLSVGKEQKNTYVFEFTGAELQNYTNFYAILCPVSSMNDSILITQTLILCDRYDADDSEYNAMDSETEKTETITWENSSVTEEMDFDGYFIGDDGSYLYGVTYFFDENSSYSVKMTVLDPVTGKMMKSVSKDILPGDYVSFSGNGFVVNRGNIICLYNNLLDEIYEGEFTIPIDEEEYGELLSIQGNLLYLGCANLVYSYDANEKAAEQLIKLDESLTPLTLYPVEAGYVLECADSEAERGYSVVTVFDGVVNSYSGYRLQFCKEDCVLMYIPAEGWEHEEPYVYALSLNDGQITQIELKDYTQTTRSKIYKDNIYALDLSAEDSISLWKYDLASGDAERLGNYTNAEYEGAAFVYLQMGINNGISLYNDRGQVLGWWEL